MNGLRYIGILGLCAILAGGMAGCRDEMADQPRYDPYSEAKLFPDNKVMQAPPPGAIARDDPAWQLPYLERPPLTAALLARGRERFDIYCSPCHGYAGDGHGIVPSRGFPQPPTFHSKRLRDLPSRHVFDVISNGYGVMYAYADRISPADRWAIAAYVRALQVSQGARADQLPADDRDALKKRSQNAPAGQGGAG